MQSVNGMPATSDSLRTCLIIGGAGFVGTYLCERLLDQNCFVYCLDHPQKAQDKTIIELGKRDNFIFIPCDLNNMPIPSFDRKIDYVFQVAGLEDSLGRVGRPAAIISGLAQVTKQILEVTKASKAKFVLISSEVVHEVVHSGRDFTTYFWPSHSENIERVYLETKRAVETLTAEYTRTYGLDARIVRLAFLYGPLMNLNSGDVLATILFRVLNGLPLVLPKNGKGLIYPTYINDAVLGIIKAAFATNSIGKIYGIVNPKAYTVKEVAEIIQKRTAVTTQPNYEVGDDTLTELTLAPEIIKSQEALGWYPRISLEQGIENTLASLPVGTNKQLDKPKEVNAQTAIPVIPTPIQQSIQAPLISFAPKYVQTQTRLTTPVMADASLNTIPSQALTTSTPILVKPDVISSSLWQKVKQKRFRKPAILNITLADSPRLKKRLKVASVITAALLIIFGPTLATYALGGYGVLLLNQTKKAMSLQQWNSVETKVDGLMSNYWWFQKANALSSVPRKTLRVPVPKPIEEYVLYGDGIINSVHNVQLAKDHTTALAKIIFGKEEGDAKKEVQDILANLTYANEHLGFLEAQTQQESNNDLAGQIRQWRQQVKAGLGMATLLNDSLGFAGKRTFLILLQDNQELRPTGGFIEGVAIITVNNGKIIDSEFRDVYSLDKELKGKVIPPEEITRFLGEEAWWLRDANFSPNFPESAARTVWFVKNELGITADGVMSVDLTFLKNMLEATGELYVPEYNETLTAENLNEKAQRHAQVNFFEKQQARSQPFTVLVANYLFKRLRDTETDVWPAVFSAFYKGFSEKNVNVWLPDTSAEGITDQMGWNGSLRPVPSNILEFGQVSAGDFLGVYEANFGVNKTNYFIERLITHKVVINDTGKVQATSSLVLNNKSITEAWPGGTYKTYLRFYIPKNAQVDGVAVNQASGKNQAVKKEDLILKVEDDKQSVGLFVEIPPQQAKQISVTYSLTDSIINNGHTGTYALFVQKQSGTDATPLTVSIEYPSTLKPVKVTPQGTFENAQLKFTQALSQDRMIAVSFSQ